MVEAVAAMLARWEAAAAEGSVIDAAREMTGLTYDIISRTVFSSEIETGADVMSAAITRFFDTHGRIDLWDVFQLPGWLPRPAEWRVRPATRVFRDEVRRLLERRRARQTAGQPVPNDLVSLLAAARDPETGAALSEQTIHDNLVTFIGAGHETTANALGWTLFLLSEYPWAFDRMAPISAYQKGCALSRRGRVNGATGTGMSADGCATPFRPSVNRSCSNDESAQ